MANAQDGITRLINRVKQIQEWNQALTNTCKDLQDQIYALDQYIRRENVEIHNIPDRITQEDLEPYVLRIFECMGIKDISSYSIAACHRLAPRPGLQSKPVIIRFVNRKDAQTIRQFKYTLRTKAMPFDNLYITENLIRPRRCFYEKLREMKRHNEISECWTYNGKIMFRDTHSPNEKPKCIQTLADINKYFRKKKKSMPK